MRKIKVNKIRCKRCGDIIESTSVHDFKFCSCESVAVDGGKDYLRRCGNLEDIEDLSEYYEEQKSKDRFIYQALDVTMNQCLN